MPIMLMNFHEISRNVKKIHEVSLKPVIQHLGSLPTAPLFASFGQDGTASHHPGPISFRPCEQEKRPEHGPPHGRLGLKWVVRRVFCGLVEALLHIFEP